MLPGITELAELIKAQFGYCQIEHDMKTVPLSPPVMKPKDRVKQSRVK